MSNIVPMKKNKKKMDWKEEQKKHECKHCNKCKHRHDKEYAIMYMTDKEER